MWGVRGGRRSEERGREREEGKEEVATSGAAAKRRMTL